MTTHNSPTRGGTAVGLLTELPPLEAGAVRYLRHWFGGAEARADLYQTFRELLGADLADSAFDAFGRLCDFCVKHGRRPLVRHGMTCSCLGADENCFANLLAAAATDQTGDAALLASLLVRPQQVQTLSALAAQFGLLLQQVTPGTPRRRIYRAASATLH